jgi:hypothetical protein
MLMPIGRITETDGFLSATAWGKGQTADVHFQDGVLVINSRPSPVNECDDLVKAWQKQSSRHGPQGIHGIDGRGECVGTRRRPC